MNSYSVWVGNLARASESMPKGVVKQLYNSRRISQKKMSQFIWALYLQHAMIDLFVMLVQRFQTWFKQENESKMGLKLKRLKIIRPLFKQSSTGTGGSTRKNFTKKKNDKSEKDVDAISPNPRHQQSCVPLAPIYQLAASPPPHLAYHTMYPPPQIYHQ